MSEIDNLSTAVVEHVGLSDEQLGARRQKVNRALAGIAITAVLLQPLNDVKDRVVNWFNPSAICVKTTTANVYSSDFMGDTLGRKARIALGQEYGRDEVDRNDDYTDAIQIVAGEAEDKYRKEHPYDTSYGSNDEADAKVVDVCAVPPNHLLRELLHGGEGPNEYIVDGGITVLIRDPQSAGRALAVAG